MFSISWVLNFAESGNLVQAKFNGENKVPLINFLSCTCVQDELSIPKEHFHFPFSSFLFLFPIIETHVLKKIEFILRESFSSLRFASERFGVFFSWIKMQSPVRLYIYCITLRKGIGFEFYLCAAMNVIRPCPHVSAHFCQRFVFFNSKKTTRSQVAQWNRFWLSTSKRYNSGNAIASPAEHVHRLQNPPFN